LVSTNFPGAAVVCFVDDFAGLAVEATWAKVMFAKNRTRLSENKILNAVFMVF
jgi:hypothetical protein